MVTERRQGRCAHGRHRGSSWRHVWGDSLAGALLFLTVSYEDGSTVEEYIARTVRELVLVVHSPMPEDFVRPDE